MSETDYDVIVAGYGPVGETCANLLGYYKIKSLIIDKETGVFPVPRAITWDRECERAMSACEFSENIDPIELLWHRDDEDRTLEILGETNWKIQLDNELPTSLNEPIFIPKHHWHRVIKGDNSLKLKIYKK